MSVQFASPPAHLPPIHAALAGAPSWAPVAEDAASTQGGLRPIGPAIRFAQDQEIYGEGDDAEIFFKVVSGVVRTCKFLSDGRRQIEAFHVAGDLLGFEPGPGYSLTAEAVCECVLVPYRRRSVEALLMTDEAVSRQVFSHAMRSLSRAQEHSLLLGRRSALEKVAAFLIDWAQYSPDRNLATLAMTRLDMADYLGLTIETVSRTLSQLERDALIELPATRQIRLKDLAALQDLNS
ncbi:MAG TPA: helix-turn-helix domain-containing protein [Aliidongia sp.]|nr:helix-turn-helix domain-containing protein [Aliidongia sp.]